MRLPCLFEICTAYIALYLTYGGWCGYPHRCALANISAWPTLHPTPTWSLPKTIENQLCSFSNRSGCWGGRHTARSQRRRRGGQRRSRGGERRREGTREGGEGDEKLTRRRKFHFPSTCQNIRFYFQLFWCVCLLAFSYMASSSSFDPLHYGKVDFWQKCIVSFEEKSLTLQPSVFYVLKNIL